jgi:hypothetical protein
MIMYTQIIETFKAEAEKHNVPLKVLMQYAFILKNGSEKQKADAGNEESEVKIEGIYKEVMNGASKTYSILISKLLLGIS